MNISSLNNPWLFAQSLSSTANTVGSSTANATQGTTSTGSVSSNSSNDGDTFQMSLLAAQMMNSTTQPQSSNSTLSSDLSTLLTKVQGGTATSTDLQNMQNELQQTQQSTSGSGSVQGHHHHHHHAASITSDPTTTSNSTNSSTIGSDLSSFISKVAAGTATTSDLTNMENEMAPLLQQVTATGQSASATNTQAIASSATNGNQGVSPVTSSTNNSVQNVNAIAQAFLNSATSAYNTQAYFASTSW